VRNEKCQITIAASVATAYTEAARDISKLRREAVEKGAYTPGGTIQGCGISRKIRKFGCVRLFKCFTVFDIRPPEVFCDV